LARSREWQIKFANSKDLKTKLFFIDESLTFLQEIFVEWLRTYSNVYETFHAGYYSILTQEVIENDLFLDAYFVWIKYDRDEKLKKQKDYENKLKYTKDLKGHPDTVDVTIFEKED